jgi:alcohol dehydrogenase, propanol-preferring
LPDPKLPVVPGHEIVGRVAALGPDVRSFALGARVGVPWLGEACGGLSVLPVGPRESLRRAGLHRLHPRRRLCDAHAGGCALLIRAARKPRCGRNRAAALRRPDWLAQLSHGGTGRSARLYGFGAAAHILAQVAIWQGRRVFAFTRAGDIASQDFARSLGAVWAGSSDEMPPEKLDAAIIFAPVGALVPAALAAVKKGGRVVCGGIHMSDIPSFPYRLLWEERQLLSVANLTRRDAYEFLATAPRAGIKMQVTRYPLDQANVALDDLRQGRFEGAAVLVP